MLLKATVMVRRMKEEVIEQLPSKRRQVVKLKADDKPASRKVLKPRTKADNGIGKGRSKASAAKDLPEDQEEMEQIHSEHERRPTRDH